VGNCYPKHHGNLSHRSPKRGNQPINDFYSRGGQQTVYVHEKQVIKKAAKGGQPAIAFGHDLGTRSKLGASLGTQQSTRRQKLKFP